MKFVYTYAIALQFAKPCDTPTFPSIEKLIQDAISYYNKKSFNSANPKEIIGYTFDHDDKITLILKSQNELTEAFAGKALRVFSIYLIEHGLSGEIYNQRLFKTSCTFLGESTPCPTPPKKDENIGIQEKLDLILLKLENIEKHLNIGGDTDVN